MSEITVKRRETSMQRVEPSQSLSKQKEIIGMLTKLSLRRGSAMNQETLAIYAQDLSSYELSDIAAVLDHMGKQPPEEFKQLWPAVGTIIQAIETRVREKGSRGAIERENAQGNEQICAPAAAFLPAIGNVRRDLHPSIIPPRSSLTRSPSSPRTFATLPARRSCRRRADNFPKWR